MTNGGMKAISELTATNNGLKIKMHNQRGAMKQLAELQGFDAAKEVNVTVTKTLDDFYND
jgi:phage terminase small subunit